MAQHQERRADEPRVAVVCDHGTGDTTALRSVAQLSKIDNHDGGQWSFVHEPGSGTPLPEHARDRDGRRVPAVVLACPECGRAPRVNLRTLSPALDRLVAVGLDQVRLCDLDRR